ncbi:MAG: ABC transporter ATP-binding protein [Planctomycetales bacterium]|nr:ABC transporter ATP-binding protein [Planctomycetales bacterium]
MVAGLRAAACGRSSEVTSQTTPSNANGSSAPTSDKQPVILTRELTKHYGNFVALDSLTMDVARGEILGFIGPNGAGKTTTIKILVGLARPTSGSASINGVDCERSARDVRKMVGYMPDKFGSYDNMRVLEYLDFFASAFGIHGAKRKQRIADVLELTGAGYMRDRFVESLSHGMQKKVGIARTLLHDPQVLIFDEPANGLDPQARIDLRELLLELGRLGKTLIVTSHILPELSRICDKVAIITHGKMRAFGNLADIMSTLRQRRTIEVQVESHDQLQLAEQRIRPRLSESDELSLSEAEGMVRFTTENQDDFLADIVGDLIAGGVRVVQFREVQADLEDAFLSVTREAEEPKAELAKASDPGVKQSAARETA